MTPIYVQVTWSKVKVKLLILTTQYLLTLCLMVIKLDTLVDFYYCFWCNKVKLLVSISALSSQYFMNHLLDIIKHKSKVHLGSNKRMDDLFLLCNPFDFCLRGDIYVSQTFLVFS